MTIDENIPLQHLTTFKIGGSARYFCVAKSIADLKEAAIFAQKAKLPIFVLGGGSNILVSDEGFHGLVIKMAMRGIKFADLESHSKIEVGAGEGWDEFVRETIKNDLWGLENLSGIPGTVGGAPVQNIGAYGAEISSFVDSVEIFDADSLTIRNLSSSQCRFRYRDSLFKRPEAKKYIITAVTFKLPKDGRPNISYKDLNKYFSGPDAPEPSLREIRRAVLKIRSEKFPPLEKFGTAGSFFKNPIVNASITSGIKKNFPDMPVFEAGENLAKLPLAWILDKVCNFKGKRMGHVGLYDTQPAVLVNWGDATAHEVSVFANKVAADVRDKTGVDIEREVQSIGEDNPPRRYQTWFWTIVYYLLPKITAVIQAAGWHHFRQNYTIGFLEKNKTAENFVKHLHKMGYSKAYMAWKDLGEVLSMRKIVRRKFQYHIRLFEDGEIRGHYEYAPEANPLGHLYEVVFTDPKDYFEHLFHGFLEK